MRRRSIRLKLQILVPTRNTALATEIRAIRTSLGQLQRSFDRLVPILTAKAPPVGTGRRKLKITPARRAALKLQGRYLGFMRQLKPAQKAKVKKVRAVKGIRAAIATARKLAS